MLPSISLGAVGFNLLARKIIGRLRRNANPVAGQRAIGSNAVKAEVFENICIGAENLMEDLGLEMIKASV